MRMARDLYLACIEESPEYAPAWARLGRVYHFLGKFENQATETAERSEQAFQRAFSLNPDLAIAHNMYTPTECDRGRTKQAMLRLMGQVRIRRNDPELFAGLVQACRYCDELKASIAAHFRGRHLDSHLITSAAHTYFLLGDYSNALECYGTKPGYYLDCAALAALGEERLALSMLRERELSGGATGAVRMIMRSLRAYLEGNAQECLNAILASQPLVYDDPEISYYSARHMARINETDHAIAALGAAIDRGFLCATAIAHDPWLESLRSSRQYAEFMQEAGRRCKDTHEAFLAAGGEDVISLT